jgi:hypothetical protein
VTHGHEYWFKHKSRNRISTSAFYIPLFAKGESGGFFSGEQFGKSPLGPSFSKRGIESSNPKQTRSTISLAKNEKLEK